MCDKLRNELQNYSKYLKDHRHLRKEVKKICRSQSLEHLIEWKSKQSVEIFGIQMKFFRNSHTVFRYIMKENVEKFTLIIFAHLFVLLSVGETTCTPVSRPSSPLFSLLSLKGTCLWSFSLCEFSLRLLSSLSESLSRL